MKTLMKALNRAVYGQGIVLGVVGFLVDDAEWVSFLGAAMVGWGASGWGEE